MLDLLELVFPLTGHLRFREDAHFLGVQELVELEGFGEGDEFLALTFDVSLREEFFDGGGTCRWRAETAFLHRFGEGFVVDELAGVFHRTEERGFVVAGRRLGRVFLDVDAVDLGLGGRTVAGSEGGEARGAFLVLVFFGFCFLAPDGAPTGDDEHLARRAEIMFTDEGRTDGLFELSHREEDGDEATDDEVVDLLLDVGQAVGDGAGRDDGEVVADLFVIEDATAGGIDPATPERFLGEDSGRMGAFEGLEGGLGVWEVILGQVLGIGTRIGERLVLFVESLGDA